MRCRWCHNPESWENSPYPVFLSEKCIDCSACAKLCEAREKPDIFSKDLCKRCGDCAKQCYAGALTHSCRIFTPDELWQLLSVDKPYFDNSNGGVTFSGGECMLQKDFLEEIVNICRKNNVHTAVDTAGHVPYEWLTQVNPDMFLYDIKAASTEKHKALTGVDGVLIWENLHRLLDDGYEVIVRVPCVPGANWDELLDIAKRLKDIGVKNVELLPYHKLGEGKFELYGENGQSYNTPRDEEIAQIENKYFNFIEK